MQWYTMLGIISGSIAALGVIIAALIKIIKFTSNVNTTVEFVQELKKQKAVDAIKKAPIYDKAVKEQSNIVTDLQEIKDMLIKLDKNFEGHCEVNGKQTDLMINQARYTLQTVMKDSINQGYAPIEEKQIIGDLFAAYAKNNSNHGVKDIFDVYKQLPVNRPEDK